MKERPILFSAPMVRAILAGRKTQTRRVVKPQPFFEDGFWHLHGAAWSENIRSVPAVLGHSLSNRNPYGQPGDQLWVRETFDPIYPQNPNYNGGRPIEIDYAATPRERMKDHHGMRKWKPSIHMPRDFSRIQLEIIGIRVERLLQITEQDCKNEGVIQLPDGNYHNYFAGENYEYKDGAGFCPMTTATSSFWSLWSCINGRESWNANPWVWVVEFKVIKP